MKPEDLLLIDPEISEALASKKPVVALESTIISHGMPYPRNVSTALEVEAIVRENGTNLRIKIHLAKDRADGDKAKKTHGK